MITLAIANQKGGVGKTTTAVTLAHLWAKSGIKVLLIDLDPQGNCADCLGMGPGNETVKLLMPGINTFHTVEARENLHLMRMDKSGAQLKNVLAGETLRELVLRNMLSDHDLDFDLAILDCAPSTDILQVCAMCAADWVLVPTKLDQLSVKGVRDILTSLGQLRKASISQAKLAGALPTFYDKSTSETQVQLNNLVVAFEELVLPPIPCDTLMREAVRKGQTILEYAPTSRTIKGYKNGSRESLGGYEQAQDRLEQIIWSARW